MLGERPGRLFSHVIPFDMKRLVEQGIPATIWGVLNSAVSYNMDFVRPMLTEAQWERAYPSRVWLLMADSSPLSH